MYYKFINIFFILVIFLSVNKNSFADIETERVYAVYLTWEDDPTSTMTINWITTKGVTSTNVQYRRVGTTAWHNTVGNTRPHPHSDRIIHRVKLTNLSSHTDYQFRIAGFNKNYLFRTMPDNLDEPVNFITGGDVAYGTEARALNRRAAEKEPYFIMIGGDFAYADGLPDKVHLWHTFWDNWYKNVITPAGRLVPIIPAIGNHEVRGGFGKTPNEAPYFYAFFSFPGLQAYNVLDFKHYLSLVILDSEHTTPVSGPQTLWLDNVLKNRTHITHVFPLYHVPAYPSHRDFMESTSLKVRTQWTPVFDNYNIHFAFENHDHTYKITHPIKNQNPNPDGIIYVGDGAWGVEPRIPKTSNDRWYIRNANQINHVLHITIDHESVLIEAINILGHVFDDYYKNISQPVLHSPKNKVDDANTSPLFVWSELKNTASYRLQIAPDPQFTTSVLNNFTGTDTLVRISGLEPGKTYYWRVRATRSDREYYSAIRTFTTSVNPPEVPELSKPADGSSDLQPAMHLYWNQTGYANDYRIQIAKDMQFENLVVNNGGIVDTFHFVYELIENSTYFWRVRAYNSVDISDWSQTFTFHTSNRVATSPDHVQLACNPYIFDYWSQNSSAGTFPNGMIFHTTGDLVPVLDSEVNGNWDYEFDLNIVPRFMGLNDKGILLFNRYNPDMQDTIIKTPAAVVLALDHTNRTNITVNWTNETYRRGDWNHKIRLQYRTSIQMPFTDFPDINDQPIEYQTRHDGHTQDFSVKIPEELLTHDRIFLRWKFYTDSNALEYSGSGIIINNIRVYSREKLIYQGLAEICEQSSKTIQLNENPKINRIRWYFNNQIISSERSHKLMASTQGYYFARINYSDGCADSTDIVYMIVNPLPDIPEITIDKSLLISSSTEGNQWYFEGNLIPDANHYVYVPTDSGRYYVIVTDENNCSSQSAIVDFDATKYNFRFEEEELIIFPNPNSGLFTLAFQAKEDEVVVITILDTKGNSIYRHSFLSRSDRPYIKDIDMTSISDGVYIVNLYKDNKVESRNIVIDKSTGLIEEFED